MKTSEKTKAAKILDDQLADLECRTRTHLAEIEKMRDGLMPFLPEPDFTKYFINPAKMLSAKMKQFFKENPLP